MRHSFVVLALSAALSLAACSNDEQAAGGAPGAQMPPPEVGVVVMHKSDVALSRELVGRLSAFRSADVRARVRSRQSRRVPNFQFAVWCTYLRACLRSRAGLDLQLRLNSAFGHLQLGVAGLLRDIQLRIRERHDDVRRPEYFVIRPDVPRAAAALGDHAGGLAQCQCFGDQ